MRSFFLSVLMLLASLLPQQGVFAASPESSQVALSGTILETMDAAGYTYLQLDNGREKVWVAIPETRIEKGRQVSCAPGMVMNDFTSPSLNRTFAAIVFSPGLLNESTSGTMPAAAAPVNNPEAAAAPDTFEAALQAEAAAPDPHAGLPMDAGAVEAMSAGSTGAIVPLADIQVDKAEGEHAVTVGESFARAKELDGKPVRIRGQVMKNSRMIMGRNWVHLQDGSGDPLDNTHDLVVTTLADPEEGELVVIEGTLHADRDFGAGYTYKVIIEDAMIVQ